jgi:hypothetical protein
MTAWKAEHSSACEPRFQAPVGVRPGSGRHAGQRSISPSGPVEIHRLQRALLQHMGSFPVIGRVVEKFLGCGDLTKDFARVRRDTCRHEYLLAFVLERSGNPARSGTRGATSARPATRSGCCRSGSGWPTRSWPRPPPAVRLHPAKDGAHLLPEGPASPGEAQPVRGRRPEDPLPCRLQGPGGRPMDHHRDPHLTEPS